MKYKQLQTNMSVRHLPLMLSLLLLLCSCHESGHDPGKELYEQQLQQKGLLAHRIDSLFTSTFTDPLGVERGLEELYLNRGVSAGTLSSDPFFYSQVTYVRKALSFSLRAHSLQTLLASEHFDHFQTMIRLGSAGSASEEYPATDPTVLLQIRSALEGELRQFLEKEAPSYALRDQQKEEQLRTFVQERAIGRLDQELASYKSFTGREAELEGKVWHQEAYKRGEDPGYILRVPYTMEKLFEGKITFGRDHQLQLDSLQLPTSYYSFTYGYQRGEIFKSFEGRGRGIDNSIFAVFNGPMEPTGQRYYFGERYLTLILPLKTSTDYPKSSRYTIAITLEYDQAKYKDSPRQLIPRYEYGLGDTGQEGPLDPYLFYSIYDERQHWGTILVRNYAPNYVWAGPVSFRPAP